MSSPAAEASEPQGETELAKYEAWIRELEERQQSLAGDRAFYIKFFVALVPISALGFLWSRLLGMGTLFTGILMCAFAFYFVFIRQGDYAHHLELLRKTASDLRQKQGSAPSADSENR
jgi:hypothetical protein